MKDKAKKALGWDFVGTLSTQGVGFVISIFLARLLEPAEFGLVGMAMVFIAISHAIVNMGFSSALIQQKEVSKLTYSSVFFVNTAIGVLVAALFYLVSPQIANFYGKPEVEPVLKWLSFGIIINSLNIVQQTILQRELRFKELSIRQFFAGLFSGLIGIWMAFQGYGVYSLVVQSLAGGGISTVLLWSISGWKPNMEFSKHEIQKLWSFGSYVFLAGILANVTQRIDVLLIGKLFTPATLGFFSRAESLNNLVSKYSSTSLKRVFFPVLSTLQDEHKRFEAAFLKVLSIAAFGIFLLSGCLMLTGDFIIVTLFGEKWIPSIFIFQILMIKVFVYPINTMVLSSFLAYGKSKDIFWLDQAPKVLKIGGWGIAWFYGFEAYLYSLIVIHLAATVYYNLIVHYFINISFKKQASAIYSFGLFFTLLIIPFFELKRNLPDSILLLLLLVIGFIICFMTLVFFFKKTFFDELRKEISPLFSYLK